MSILAESAEFLIPLSWSSYPFEISPGAEERYDFYQASIYPTAYFGGTHLVEGWDCSTVTFQEAYDNVVESESSFTVDLEFNQLRDDSFEIIADVNVTESMTNFNNKIFFVITNWVTYTEENPWFYLVVAKSDEEDVSIINIGESATYTAELSVEMQPDWNLEDLHAVAIIQSWDNHKILQADQVSLFPTSVIEPVVPVEISLHQNYPNPFNPSTTISFSVAQTLSSVELVIYNLKGQKVKTLDCHPEFIEGTYTTNSTPRPSTEIRMTQAGTNKYSVIWNGTDDNGNPVSSGIYLYKLRSGIYTTTKKMILMK